MCRDFVWDDNTQAAITIINTENVVLNFNQKKIVNNTATTLGIISVQNSTNVELINVHLQGVNGSRGIVLTNSTNIQISKFQIFDFNPAIQTAGGNVLNISDFYIRNSAPISGQRSMFINDTNDVTIKRGSILNGRLVLMTNTGQSSSQQVSIEKLKINNSAGIQFGGRALQTFGYNNVRIAENELIGGADVTLLVSAPVLFDPIYVFNIIVENNLIRSIAGTAFQAQLIDGITVRDNQIKTAVANGANFNMVNRASISNNNISGSQVPTASAVGMSFGGDRLSSFYNTAKNNFVSGYDKGFSDNFGLVFPAICTTFFENVATGNFDNYDLIHPTTISVDNISGCEIAPIVNEDSERTSMNNFLVE